MLVYHMFAVPQRTREGVVFFGTGVQTVCVVIELGLSIEPGWVTNRYMTERHYVSSTKFISSKQLSIEGWGPLSPSFSHT